MYQKELVAKNVAITQVNKMRILRDLFVKYIGNEMNRIWYNPIKKGKAIVKLKVMVIFLASELKSIHS